MDLAKIERAKNLAAVKALEAYAATLKAELSEDELRTMEMHNTEHVHTALMIVGDERKTGLVIVARWRFTTDPAIVAKVVAAAKDQGSA